MTRAIAGLALLVVAGGWTQASRADSDRAKAIFREFRCHLCHSVKVAGIEKDENIDGEKAEKDSPDLSGAGLDGDRAWIMNFLQKTGKGKDDLYHFRKFKGSDEELEELVDWLVTLKTGEPASKVYEKNRKLSEKQPARKK